MVQIRRTTESSPSRVSARALPWLSRRTGLWAIAFSFLAVAAFSTAPSSLYGLYEQQEHLSSLTITIVYAVYALGIVVNPVSRSGRVAARLNTWFSSIWRVFRPSLTALGVHRPSWASHSGL